ncbi:UDP-N-acetylglucosamine 4,6-dehydratase (inverting) [Candidatus Pacearchaeota archaeon]|nr:UDP-N-acetylglucosamine 4,6-dehydratase (inverting) [Candidatus Pacearchaeota archaeon]|tara:strand:- start:6199 stop:7038 length:840 start_codon:yes stop_codon:yes gene_type:complete
MRILITGITGTMGREILNLILSEPARDIRVLGISRDEQKQRSLPIYDRFQYSLCDIRNKESLRRICVSGDVHHIIHLAALKCVDTIESNVYEAIQTNVIGTQNVCDVASEIGASVVLASTDKACYPINAYGNTKALAEKIVLSANGVVCRYGNIIGSRGSFVNQIINNLLNNKEIPITNNNMTRFWLKPREVAEFILNGTKLDSDLYIKESFSCHVTSIVTSLAELLKVKDYSMKEVGIRPGEKIHETLRTHEEGGLITSAMKLCTEDVLKDFLMDWVK